ncbi:Predicted nuclease of the RNAse H fold, HicB family [Lachnospiraceae bacterium G41]|nr:Predicted nuclease of the RNAse H fold, HicB family [Lachnospiraceae bacterium G41]
MVKYPYVVLQTEVEGQVFWIAKSTYLKGCVGQGDEKAEAISELEENEKAWLETAAEIGMEIPEIPIEHM